MSFPSLNLVPKQTIQLLLIVIAMFLAGRTDASEEPESSSKAEARSIARAWNEEALSAIRKDTPHPPVHARNLFHLSVAMYDAWAAYDPVAVGYLYRGK